MDSSSIFDELNKEPNEFNAFFDANIDSITNFFDLNQLDNYATNTLTNKVSSHEFLFDQSNWSNGSSMSPSDSSSSSPKNSDSSPSSNSTSDFNFLDENQQKILELETQQQQQHQQKNIQPISFILPETVENGMKITNEIILNFDQMDETKLYEQYEILSKIDLSQQLNVITMDSNETRIQLNDCSKMSDDEDEDDDKDDSEEQSVSETKIKNRKVNNDSFFF